MKGYETKEPKLTSKSAKDASAYKESAGAGATGAKKSASLDKTGGVAKKDDSQYKEHCKDQ